MGRYSFAVYEPEPQGGNVIELRWVERSVPMPHNPNIGRTDKVLQYRERDMNAVGMLPGPWSPWRDVPTVKEE